MLVETFECQETAAEPIEAGEEAIALMESLGLSGQQALVSKTGKSGRDERMPYREITKDEEFAYRVICPSTSKLAEYSKSPIPLRVLQVASHAHTLGMFERLDVWHAAEFVEKDPVLVGVRRKPGSTYEWEKVTYILARWGEELETFSVLLKRAIAAKREQYRQQVVETRAKLDMALAQVESLSDAKIIGCGSTGGISLSTPVHFV